MEATKRPWKFDDTPGCRAIKGGKLGHNKQAQYVEVATTVGLHDDKEDRANASLIVRAVNTFDQAKAALQTAREALVHTGFCCGDTCIDEIDQALAAMEAPQ